MKYSKDTVYDIIEGYDAYREEGYSSSEIMVMFKYLYGTSFKTPKHLSNYVSEWRKKLRTINNSDREQLTSETDIVKYKMKPDGSNTETINIGNGQQLTYPISFKADLNQPNPENKPFSYIGNKKFIDVQRRISENGSILAGLPDIRYNPDGISYGKNWLCENNEEIVDKEIESLADLMKEKNLSTNDIRNILYHDMMNKNNIHTIDEGEDGELLLGIVSDTHLGSKECALSELHKFYDICSERGVSVVVNGGDLVDGRNVYKGHEFDLADHSLGEQSRRVIDDYPSREGITTYAILGNHDESWYKIAGQDIGQMIAPHRDDIKFLGFYNAKIEINGINVELQHGGGGNSYAISYKIQKYLDTKTGANSPDIYVLGHYHTAAYLNYRGIHAYMPGAFLKENLLSKRFQLGNTIGGWIVKITKKDGVTSVNSEFIEL